MRCSTRRPAARAAASATSIRKACFARSKSATSIELSSSRIKPCTSDGEEHGDKEEEQEGSGEKARGEKSNEAQGGQEFGSKEWIAEALDQAVWTGRQGARRCEGTRLHPCAVGPDLHAASRLHGCRLHQGRAARRR